MDEKDILLLEELQKDCRQSLKKLARKLSMSITTVYDRMKKLEKEGVIKGYKAILDPDKTGNEAIAFILVRMEYFHGPDYEPLSQREIAKKISQIPGVMEVHIIAGEWDILIKARGKTIKDIGNFVIDRLRMIRGVGRTLTCDAWVTAKESPDVYLRKPV
ncbi:MAG: Lrp/AsnC family transcriptional regulator [Candidatus Aenigmarchaeota archaeon]|nr:Lrp/AsnC family transcriptional regulator [Candidatus Aenigmarchaeota archaeon]